MFWYYPPVFSTVVQVVSFPKTPTGAFGKCVLQIRVTTVLLKRRCCIRRRCRLLRSYLIDKWVWNIRGVKSTGGNRNTRLQTCRIATLSTTSCTWTATSHPVSALYSLYRLLFMYRVHDHRVCKMSLYRRRPPAHGSARQRRAVTTRATVAKSHYSFILT
jgi:hypothetical protein